MATRKTTDPDYGDQAVAEVEPDTTVDVMTGEVMTQDELSRQGDTGLGRYLADEDAYRDPDRTQAYRQIIDQILNASTPEDVLTPIEAVNAKDVCDRPMTLYSFDINQSEFDVGSPFYATMKVRFFDDDNPTVVNSGNQALMAQLIRLSQLDAFPVTVTIKQGKRPNRHGTFPLRLNSALAPAPAPAT